MLVLLAFEKGRLVNSCVQEETLTELQNLFEKLMRDAYDIGLDKDSPRASQRNRFSLYFDRKKMIFSFE